MDMVQETMQEILDHVEQIYCDCSDIEKRQIFTRMCGKVGIIVRFADKDAPIEISECVFDILTDKTHRVVELFISKKWILNTCTWEELTQESELRKRLKTEVKKEYPKCKILSVIAMADPNGWMVCIEDDSLPLRPKTNFPSLVSFR